MQSCNSCLFVFMLLVVFIILLLVRLCSYKQEHFAKIKYSEPCSHNNFDDKLKLFYKISKKYRHYENKMKEAQNNYDKNYNLLLKEARKIRK